MADLAGASPTPTVESAATPSSAPETTVGTAAINGDAGNGQGASVEETFGNVDPRTLPPALKAVYDNMLRGFKEKTTKLSETVKSQVAKETEALRQKADFYDQIARQEEFVKQWNEHVQRVNGQNGQQQTDAQGNPVIDELKNEINVMKEQFMKTELMEVTNGFADAVDEKGAKLRPEFDRLNSLMLGSAGENGEDQFSLLRAAIELAPGGSPAEKLAKGYEIAKGLYNQILEEGKKMGMGRVNSKILGSTQPPSGIAPNGLTLTEKRPKNAREAIEMARKGVMVSRD